MRSLWQSTRPWRLTGLVCIWYHTRNMNDPTRNDCITADIGKALSSVIFIAAAVCRLAAAGAVQDGRWHGMKHATEWADSVRTNAALPNARTHEFFALGIRDTDRSASRCGPRLGRSSRRQGDLPALSLPPTRTAAPEFGIMLAHPVAAWELAVALAMARFETSFLTPVHS